MSTQKQSTAPNPADKGEGMLLAFYERRGGSFRPVIFVAPMEDPENMQELVLGRWFVGLKAAQRAGAELYFKTYETRYGFKHPEDPRLTKADGPLPYTVVCESDNDAFNLSRTYDPDLRNTSLHA